MFTYMNDTVDQFCVSPALHVGGQNATKTSESGVSGSGRLVNWFGASGGSTKFSQWQLGSAGSLLFTFISHGVRNLSRTHLPHERVGCDFLSEHIGLVKTNSVCPTVWFVSFELMSDLSIRFHSGRSNILEQTILIIFLTFLKLIWFPDFSLLFLDYKN